MTIYAKVNENNEIELTDEIRNYFLSEHIRILEETKEEAIKYKSIASKAVISNELLEKRVKILEAKIIGIR